MTSIVDLRHTAREIFDAALKSVDAGRAVRRAVQLDGSRLTICDTTFDLSARPTGIYAIAIGKAALAMAMALDNALGNKLKAGLIAGSLSRQPLESVLSDSQRKFSARWLWYEGGHPVPNEASLAAARASFDLLRRANDGHALVIFLISGGGSAMIEKPRDEQTTLAELQKANQVLVTCGASIAEINAVRRAISAIKGGGLAACAPRADQVSLIISDTGPGMGSIVASGPTFDPPAGAPDAREVVARYDLASRLPASILRAINRAAVTRDETPQLSLRKHHVLLDNESALQSAAEAARARGFRVEIAKDIIEQPIAEGCAELLSRLSRALSTASNRTPVCLISGGEFACPVYGHGLGGRNSETVLRWAIEINARNEQTGAQASSPHIVALSAGTDGIDGNSPTDGALADEMTIARARGLGLDAQSFLAASDAYTFFHTLGDLIMTGPTGTNVRDVRIMLAD